MSLLQRSRDQYIWIETPGATSFAIAIVRWRCRSLGPTLATCRTAGFTAISRRLSAATPPVDLIFPTLAGWHRLSAECVLPSYNARLGRLSVRRSRGRRAGLPLARAHRHLAGQRLLSGKERCGQKSVLPGQAPSGRRDPLSSEGSCLRCELRSGATKSGAMIGPGSSCRRGSFQKFTNDYRRSRCRLWDKMQSFRSARGYSSHGTRRPHGIVPPRAQAAVLPVVDHTEWLKKNLGLLATGYGPRFRTPQVFDSAAQRKRLQPRSGSGV